MTLLDRHVLLQISSLNLRPVDFKFTFVLDADISLVNSWCKHEPRPSLVGLEPLAVYCLDELLGILLAGSNPSRGAFEESHHHFGVFVISTNVNNKFSMQNIRIAELICLVNYVLDLDFRVILIVEWNLAAIRHVGDVEVLQKSS